MNEGDVRRVADFVRLNPEDDEIAEYGEKMDEIILNLPAVINRSGK
ncbi:hypothetical protein KJ762_08125 [bacterium]|nr:hypothetical protein [bacterium]MBU1634460.1 hypothetical protein [bacterium]MBU1872876.1 hypothetical protein [bacterium]